jgi:sporulation protein YlmC with PRC-barrel domain
MTSYQERPRVMEETDTSAIVETNVETTAPTLQGDAEVATTETTVMYRDIAEWHGRELVDCHGERIGNLEEVYFDVETDEAQFGTVKEGFVGRHLTFVPLSGITIGPDNLQVPVSKEQVKHAPNIALQGGELSQADESALYHHYQLNYTPPDTHSGRRLARR